MKQNILIAGLGLIGGSIAKAIFKEGKHHLIGYDKNEKATEYALENDIIHETVSTFVQGAKKADIIVLAAPISSTINLMEELDHVKLDQQVIVTDVASVKGSIIQKANELINPKIVFIGGHPMAGSHKAGIQAAKSHLFENAIYVLMPTSKCGSFQVNLLKDVLYPTGSRFIILQPEEHDEMTSVVSHFPHLIASSLVHQAKKWENRHAYLPSLAAGGFRDITRIASSSPEMWQDIFYHNGKKISHLLKEWINEMSHLNQVLEDNNKIDMITYLKQAKEYRDGLEQDKKGAIRSFYDLYVDIQDQPGSLARVVDLLAKGNISITNIRILEIRDNIDGALRLTFASKEAQINASTILKDHGYTATIEN